MSERKWRSERYAGRKRPLKNSGDDEKTMICSKCGNKVDCYIDGSIGKHKDYGKDAKGNPIKKGAWSWCSNKKWN